MAWSGLVVLALGSTEVERLVPAVGETVVGTAPTGLALGEMPACPSVTTLGLILELGDMGPTCAPSGPRAVGPMPIARPRWAKLTLDNKPSSIPQISSFFIRDLR